MILHVVARLGSDLLRAEVVKKLLMVAASLIIALPLAGASGAVTYEGTIFGSAATPLVGPSHHFDVALEVGDTMTLTLSSPDALADLDLVLGAPAESCSLFPNTDAACVVGGLSLCDAEKSSQTLGTSEETLTFTATAAGNHSIFVVANTGEALVTGIPYELVVDGIGSLDAPTEVVLIRTASALCRTL